MIIDPGEGGEGGEVDPDIDIDDGGDDGGDDNSDDNSDIDDSSDDDLTDDEEAEYQEKMAQIRKAQDKDVDVKKKPTADKKTEDNQASKSGDNQGKEASESKDKEDKTESGGDQRHTVKINGVEKELSTEELIVLAQKSESSDQRYREGSEKQKQVEGVINLLQTDPMKVLERLNVPPEKIEQWLYDNHIAPSILEGEEKEQWERNKEFERLKSKESERDEQEKSARQEQTRQAWSNKIVGAIKNSPGLPQTEWSVNSIVNYMQRAIKGGFRDITPEEVIPYVEKEWNSVKSAQMDSLNEDQMLEYIGEAGAEKVRKALLKKHQAGQRKPRNQTRSSSKAKERKASFRKKNPRSPYDIL